MAYSSQKLLFFLAYFTLLGPFPPISVAERRRMQFSLMMKGAELFYGSSFTSSCTTTPHCSQGLCTCSSSTSAREQKFCRHSNRYGWAECYPRELSKGCSAPWIAVFCMTVPIAQRPRSSRLLWPYVLVYFIVLCPQKWSFLALHAAGQTWVSLSVIPQGHSQCLVFGKQHPRVSSGSCLSPGPLRPGIVILVLTWCL